MTLKLNLAATLCSFTRIMGSIFSNQRVEVEQHAVKIVTFSLLPGDMTAFFSEMQWWSSVVRNRHTKPKMFAIWLALGKQYAAQVTLIDCSWNCITSKVRTCKYYNFTQDTCGFYCISISVHSDAMEDYLMQLICNYYTLRQDGSRAFMRFWKFQVDFLSFSFV